MYPPNPNDPSQNTPSDNPWPGGQTPPPADGSPPPYGYPPPAQSGWAPQPGQPGNYPPYNPVYYQVPVNGGNILAIGIISLFCLGFILGPVAWVMGNNALAAIAAGQADPSQLSNVSAGRICGIIATCLHGLGTIVYIAVFALGLIAAISSGSH